MDEIRTGRFKVNFNQGINARFLTEESAEAIASVDYRDVNMVTRRIYTAWDNRKDEERLFRGLSLLVKYGVKPRHIMVYLLCGYWPGETHEDRDYRRRKIREFGALPYPMPYWRTPELVGFQRWCITHYDKHVTWEQWVQAGYHNGAKLWKEKEAGLFAAGPSRGPQNFKKFSCASMIGDGETSRCTGAPAVSASQKTLCAITRTYAQIEPNSSASTTQRAPPRRSFPRATVTSATNTIRRKPSQNEQVPVLSVVPAGRDFLPGLQGHDARGGRRISYSPRPFLDLNPAVLPP
jgi:hypothetical protein